MRAYQGEARIKADYVNVALAHEQADAYVKGAYWQEQDKRGCNIGCWTKDAFGGHGALAKDMDVPESLLHLSDGLFEALPDPDFKAWSRRFASAIPCGADLVSVPDRFLAWLLGDKAWGLGRLAEWPDHVQMCLGMAEHYRARGEGQLVARSFEGVVQGMADDVSLALAHWKSWDLSAARDFRASRAALEVWKARQDPRRGPARAAWACRAAWSARPEYARAQAEALLDRLGGVCVPVGA